LKQLTGILDQNNCNTNRFAKKKLFSCLCQYEETQWATPVSGVTRGLSQGEGAKLSWRGPTGHRREQIKISKCQLNGPLFLHLACQGGGSSLIPLQLSHWRQS